MKCRLIKMRGLVVKNLIFNVEVLSSILNHCQIEYPARIQKWSIGWIEFPAIGSSFNLKIRAFADEEFFHEGTNVIQAVSKRLFLCSYHEQENLQMLIKILEMNANEGFK